MKNLIITADDYGPVEFINKGIEDAIEADLINTVSVIMNPHKGDDREAENDERRNLVIALKNRFPNVNIGIHFSITSGFPASYQDVSTLQKENSSEFMDIFDFNYKKVDLLHVEKELRSQIDVFPGSIEIDHLSVHNGVLHLFEDFMHIYFSFAQELNIPIRQLYLKSSDLNFFSIFASRMKSQALYTGMRLVDNLNPVTLVKSIIWMKNIKEKVNELYGDSVRIPDNFIDTYFRRASEKHLKNILKNLPDDEFSEMVVHLGNDKSFMNDPVPNGINYKIFSDRQKEFDVLKEYMSTTLLQKYDIERKSFQDIP
jgi:predicted glycoside hydrolase/deacetylase ChbG (UPF0249 family)